MIKLILALSLSCLGCFSLQAFTNSGSTYTTTGSISDVQAALDAAPNGATILIPKGNYNWGGTVTMTKAQTLAGATPGKVVISHNNTEGALIKATTSAAGHATIAGISFLPGTATNNANYLEVDEGAVDPQFAILHDCSFNVPNFILKNAVDWRITGGLIYNCKFESTDDGGSSGPGSGSGCLAVKSNYDWYNASTFGNLDKNGVNLYIEDCTITNIYNQSIDMDDNARLVVRHCVLTNSQMLTHGITSKYGGRQVELYDNEFRYLQQPPNSAGISWVNLGRYFWFRAGTARITRNKVQAIWSGGYWSGSHSWVFIDESITRILCEPQTNYPGTRWPGTGSNGTTKFTPGTIKEYVMVHPSFVDPIYIWDNTSVPSEVPGGRTDAATAWTTNDQVGYECAAPGPGNQTKDVFLLNRDIFLSAPANNPSPAYTPAAYPHPLRLAEGGGAPTPTPSSTPAPTVTPPPSTPTPTPNPSPSATPTYEKWIEQQNGWIREHPPIPDH